MDPNKIDCNVLKYYMNRIHSFLTSPRTSQVFPGLSKDVEDILIKVAGQNDLNLQGFDDDSKALLSVIKSELERKKDEYQLSCDFRELSCGTRSLVYTKTMIPIMFKKPEPLRKPNSMNNTNKQPPPALSSGLITQSFKLRCLNATLKFIKDESRLSLRYPEMATVQAQHIVNMFDHSNSDGDVGLGYKTLYAPLWEAMKIFGLKYKFTLRYTDPKDRNMKCLVLDKVPIVQTVNKENRDQNTQNLIPGNTDQNTSNTSLMDISDQNVIENMSLSSTNSSPIKKNSIKIDIDKEMFKKPIKKAQLNAIPKLIDTIMFLGDEYMTGTYKKILDFIMDETAASMVFYNMSLEEAQVLTHWSQIMKTEKYKLLLSGNCMFILSQLSHNYKKKDFSVMVNEGRRKSKSDCRRNITFTKVPFGKETKEKKPIGSHSSLSSRSSVELNSSIQVTISNRSSARQDVSATGSSVKRDVSATRSSARQDVSNSRSSARRDVSNSRSSAKRDVSNSRSSAKRDVSNSRSSARQDASARQDVSNSRSSASQALGTGKTNKIKMKLLEGLDQPVSSDKAMKMMLNMGWEGGALGMRGEGITEPIRPSLDTGKRYGLGAPIEQPKQKTETISKANTKQYHTESLNLILNLLTSVSNSKEITFPERYMRKEWTYIKNVVILFNRGVQMNGGKKRLEVIDKIMEIMSDTDWLLTAGLKNDRITIVIKKSILPLFPNELKLYCEIAALTESRIYNDGTFKDIYKGLHRNVKKHVEKPGLKGLSDKTKVIVEKESSSTELNTRSGSKDQNKEAVKIEPFDDTPIVPVGNWNTLSNEKDSNVLQNITELTEDFKNNVLANILLFCKTDVEHKSIEFGHILVENQRMFIKECIEKVNMNTSFLERSLETRFYEQIIAAMDGYKITVVFSSPCSMNLEKEYPHYDLTVKNINNNVTIHYYDEDIESDGGTQDIYLDPEQSFVDDHACDKNDPCKQEKGDDQNNNVQDEKSDFQHENNNLQDKIFDVKHENNNVQDKKFDVKHENNNVQDKKLDVKHENNNVQDKKFDVKHENNNVQDKKLDVKHENNNVQDKKFDVKHENNNVQDLDDYDSDDEIQIIEGEADTITIASGDESDLLKSDSENDFSISKILTKLNDYKTSKEKSAQDKSEKVNNLEKDNDNAEKESADVGIIENRHIKVENDAGETSKELSSGKRSRSNSVNSLQFPKRLKRFCKKIAIVPENYPQIKMDDEKAREIQQLLLDAINNNSELPLLKCHGIKNGTLIYNCYTEETFILIEKIVMKANLKITYEIFTEKCNKKMAFRISTYIEESASDILNRLVKFNKGLNIDSWIVIKKEQHSDFVVIFVNIDNKSYSYLKDVNFSLYAGVDVALFTHVWD